jgi:hypothetical protein
MINVTKSDLPSLEKYTEYLEKIWSTRWLTNNGEFVQWPFNLQCLYFFIIRCFSLDNPGTNLIVGGEYSAR